MVVSDGLKWRYSGALEGEEVEPMNVDGGGRWTGAVDGGGIWWRGEGTQL